MAGCRTPGQNLSQMGTARSYNISEGSGAREQKSLFQMLSTASGRQNK